MNNNLWKKIVDVVYCCMKIFPIKKDSYLFESYDDFTEGSYLLYKYLINKNSNHRYVWIINERHKDYAKQLKIKKVIFFEYNSRKNDILKHYYYLTTERFIYSHRNIGYQKLRIGQVRLNVMHGEPFKIAKGYVLTLYKSVIRASSVFAKKLLIDTYGFEDKDVCVSISPKVLPLVTGVSESIKNKYLNFFNITPEKEIIICLMSWDSTIYNASTPDISFPFSLSQTELSVLNESLGKNNQVMIVKPHPMYRYAKKIEDIFEFNNIRVVMNDAFVAKRFDIYELLSFSSGLITDFSAVFIDYYLTEKPILFFDFNTRLNYKQTVLIENYRQYMAGPIVKDLGALLKWLEELNGNNDKYITKIREQKELWHTNNYSSVYQDLIMILDNYIEQHNIN